MYSPVFLLLIILYEYTIKKTLNHYIKVLFLSNFVYLTILSHKRESPPSEDSLLCTFTSDYCLLNASTGGRFDAINAGYTPKSSPDVNATIVDIFTASKLITASKPFDSNIFISHIPTTIPTRHPIMLT